MKRKGHPMTFFQVRRKSYRLRSHKRHPRRCPQHLLLDSLHIHHSKVDMSLHKFTPCALLPVNITICRRTFTVMLLLVMVMLMKYWILSNAFGKNNLKVSTNTLAPFIYSMPDISSQAQLKSLTDTFLGRNKKNLFCLLQNTVILSQFCLRHDISKLF